MCASDKTEGANCGQLGDSVKDEVREVTDVVNFHGTEQGVEEWRVDLKK